MGRELWITGEPHAQSLNLAKTILGFIACILPMYAQGQSLHDFMVSHRHTDDKSDVLIALDSSQVNPINTDPPQQSPASDYAAYNRMLSTIGKVHAVVPIHSLQFSSDDLPTPLDTFPFTDRLATFLAGLNQPQWRQLTEIGLSPRDVSGFERQLLTSIIPHPLLAQEYETEGNGYGTDGDPIPVRADVAQEVRLQLFKTLDIGFRALKDPQSNAGMWNGVSSLNARSANAHFYKSIANPLKAGGGGYAGRYVDNEVKRSQLNYKDAALSRSISLQTGMTLEQLFELVRTQCAVEVYPDARIAQYPLDILGDEAPASDLLQAIALCVCGTYRKVGPAYVLTSDLEGQAARGSRAMATAALSYLELQSKISSARQEIRSNHLLDQLEFRSDDAFDAKNFLASLRVSESLDGDPGWFADSLINSAMKAAIPPPVPEAPQLNSQRQNGPHYIPDPKLVNKIHLQVSAAYRLILPDGTKLDGDGISFNDGMQITTSPTQTVSFPLATTQTKVNLSAGYRTDDPEAIKTFCALAARHGLSEIWIQTKNKDVVEAAAATGLKIDLVLRPWEIWKSEALEADLNLLGQTGGQLNQIPAARYNYASNSTWWFVNSASPMASGLSEHGQKIAGLALIKGIHRVILADTIPMGYEPSGSNRDYSSVDLRPTYLNGVPIPKTLRDLVPTIYDFGYSNDLRLDCLRRFRIDPIDLESPFKHSPYYGIPSFEEVSNNSENDLQPRFGQGDAMKIIQGWEKIKNDKANSGWGQILKAVDSSGREVWVQYRWDGGDHNLPAYNFCPASEDSGNYLGPDHLLTMVTVNPMTAEDANGNVEYHMSYPLDHPFCFDFSEVPSRRLSSYFDAIFRSAQTQTAKN